MRIYLDEDIASAMLAALLQKAGHDVLTVVDAAALGRSDAAQLTLAIREARLCLTRNYDDFEQLHLLIQQARGSHDGILIVRRENDPTRDLSPKGIVAAIRRLESSGAPIHNQYIVLNQWR